MEKLSNFSSFKEQLEVTPYFESMAPFIAIALPITELLLAGLLFSTRWRLLGLYATFVLMILFTIYIIFIYFIGNGVSCSCGGIIENLSPNQHMLFNLICVSLAWLGIRYGKHQLNSTTNPRWFSTTLTLVLLGTIGWTIVTAATAPAIPKNKFQGLYMPSVNVSMLDGSTFFNTKTIPDGSPYMVMYFSPYCPHCKKELHDITTNIYKFPRTKIYLFSSYPINALQKFDSIFQLSRYGNISIVRDSTGEFLKYFNIHSIPFITIFDSQKKVAQAFLGETDISKLSRCLY